MEPLIQQPGSVSSRRDFFKRAGLGVGVIASATALQACDSDDNDDTVVDPGADVSLDFSDDFGVLNYAYALEQLEAAFYAAVISDAAFGTAFTDSTEQNILRDLAKHEAIHAAFLKKAITDAGGTAIPALTPNFEGIDFRSRTSVLTAAQTFEDLGVGAYNGAGKYIDSDAYLLIAGKIVSVEARHASVIANLITDNRIASPGQIDAMALDKAYEPQFVLTQASAFITDTIRISVAPTLATG